MTMQGDIECAHEKKLAAPWYLHRRNLKHAHAQKEGQKACAHTDNSRLTRAKATKNADLPPQASRWSP